MKLDGLQTIQKISFLRLCQGKVYSFSWSSCPQERDVQWLARANSQDWDTMAAAAPNGCGDAPFPPGSRVLGLCPLPNCTMGMNFRASIPLWSLCLPAWNQPTGSKLLKRGWQTSRWTARQNSCVSFVSLGKQAKKRNKMQYSLIIVYKNTEISYLTLCNECNSSAELFILLEKPVSRPQRISWEAERQHNLPVTLSEKKLV